jgi:hypothetical protein
MSLKANYEFLFVGKDENSFLENYAYDLFQDHGDKSGQIFVNVEIQNNPVDAEEIAGTIFETMQRVFFEDVGKDPYERFEVTLKAVNGILSEFRAQKVSGYIGNLNVIIAVIVGDELFLTQTGDSEAYLIRKRYVSIVSDGLAEDTGEEGETFTSIASGKIEPGDFVLFASTRLLRYIGKTDLAQSVNKKSITESLAEIKDAVSTEILGRVALVGIQFSKATAGEERTIEGMEDRVNVASLESEHSRVSARKETLSGKFFSAIKKGYKRDRTEVFRGRGNSALSSVTGGIKKLFKGLFSKGFGKDKILALLVIVIVVLLTGILIANGQQAAKDEIERLDAILIGVQDQIAEAETKAGYDKEVAKDLLDQAYLDAKSVFDSKYYRQKASLFMVDIEEARDKLDNVIRLSSPKVFADLSEKRSDISALGFALVGDRVFVYEYNALYETVLDQVQDPLTIDDDETVIAATGFDDRNSIVFLTQSGKLLEYKEGTISFMDTDDGSFHKGVALADWSNKIYVLDAVGDQIWKYSYKGTRDKFGAAEAYKSDDTDLSTGVDLAIDANVYSLDTSGDITKFYAGSKVPFFVNNAPFNMFKDPSRLFTNEKLDEIYILDSQEARVLVFRKDSKTGNIDYVTQYFFEGVGELRDIYVDPDTKKLYALSASKIYEVDL